MHGCVLQFLFALLALVMCPLCPLVPCAHRLATCFVLCIAVAYSWWSLDQQIFAERRSAVDMLKRITTTTHDRIMTYVVTPCAVVCLVGLVVWRL